MAGIFLEFKHYLQELHALLEASKNKKPKEDRPKINLSFDISDLPKGPNLDPIKNKEIENKPKNDLEKQKQLLATRQAMSDLLMRELPIKHKVIAGHIPEKPIKELIDILPGLKAEDSSD